VRGTGGSEVLNRREKDVAGLVLLHLFLSDSGSSVCSFGGVTAVLSGGSQLAVTEVNENEPTSKSWGVMRVCAGEWHSLSFQFILRVKL